jgi:hypothetical protein
VRPFWNGTAEPHQQHLRNAVLKLTIHLPDNWVVNLARQPTSLPPSSRILFPFHSRHNYGHSRGDSRGDALMGRTAYDVAFLTTIHGKTKAL